MSLDSICDSTDGDQVEAMEVFSFLDQLVNLYVEPITWTRRWRRGGGGGGVDDLPNN